ncbi:hypothetical protein Tsubulata_044007 [Turnera subulata]|uniref:B-like cyclin n=1 Tax=Turnera subulata TaxID=218843 RepID=A0A9Q0J017_9ROSI|nr:hypothetical protein Tsubulata_044007 [Turnera subulata]
MMVAAKAKAPVGVSRGTEDAQPLGHRTGSVRSFKVYSDNEKVKADAGSDKAARESSVPSRSISALANKRALLASASDAKGSSKTMDKIKGKHESSGPSVKQIVRRKALADVSNAQNTFSRSMARDNYKPIHCETLGKGKTRDDLNKEGGEVCSTIKGITVSADDHRSSIKNPDRAPVINSLRRNAKNSLVPTRKSLPVSRRMIEEDANIMKFVLLVCLQQKNESSGTAQRVKVFPVKVNVSKKPVPQVGTSRNYLGRSRKSDGVITMAPHLHSNVDLVSSKKVIGRSKHTAINASIVQKSSKSDCKSASFNKKEDDVNKTSKPVVAFSEAATSTVPENILVRVSDEATHKAATDDNSKSESKSIVHAKRTLNRRRSSYTSSLMTRSKVQVHFKFELMPETLYLMVTLLDRYLSQVQIKKKELQLVGLTALLLASKYEDFWHPRIKDLISISAESYTRDQMLAMEKFFLKKLKFRLNEPTPYVFMLRFLKAAQSDKKLEHLAFYLIELCLVEYEALRYKPSMLCASSIYVARSTLQIHPAWTPLLAKHTRYEVSQIRDCCEMLLRFQKAARTAQLRVTYEKYSGPDLDAVAAIEPQTKLPF